MTEVKIETQSNNLSNKISFTFFQDKIISVAEDTIMNIYDAKSHKLLKQVYLDNEYFAVASNNVDKIALGGEKCQIDIHNLFQNGVMDSDNFVEKLENTTFSEPSLAMKFSSPVQRIQWTGKFILGFSEDSEAQLYNSDTEKVLTFKPGHEGSIKNGAIDPLGEYLATTGCDGNVMIYELPQGEDGEITMVKKIKISKMKGFKTFDKYPLDVTWTQDGSMILVSGEPQLGMIKKDEDWKLTYSSEIMHKMRKDDTKQNIITTLTWINDSVLVTGGSDKIINFWNFTNKQLLYFMHIKNEALEVQYCLKEFQSFNINSMNENDIDEAMIDEIDVSQDDLKMETEEQKVTDNAQQIVKSQATVVQNGDQDIMNQAKISKAGRSILNQNNPKEVKPKEVVSKADQIIDCYPQDTMISNCQYDFPVGKYRILAWNMVGTVTLREEFDYTSVDVDFSNKGFHRNLMFRDDYHFSMASMNYSGLALASEAEKVNEDDYEEDDLEEDEMESDAKKAEREQKKLRKHSHIYFKPFSQYKTLRDWHYQLDLGENIECLANGSDWVAIYTNLNYVRVFSNEGIQKYIFSLATPLVSMTGYENLLSIAYHAGPPVYGCQAMKVRTYDMNCKNYSIISDIECPLSRTSNLVWIGYSEEGQLFTHDVEGIIRCLNPLNNQWIPILDFKQKLPSNFSQIWIVGISEKEVLAIELPKGYQAPHLKQQSMIRRFQLKLPFLEQERKDIDSKDMTLPQIEEEIMRKVQLLDFETYRKDQWEHLRHFRQKYDNNYMLSETILDSTKLTNLKKEIDKLILNAIRLCIISDDQDKVFTFMDMMHFSQSLKLCVQLCDNLQSNDLAQKISKFIQDKEQKDIMLDSYKSSSNNKNTIASRLEGRKIFRSAHTASSNEKPDLSQFAINNQSQTVIVSQFNNEDTQMNQNQISQGNGLHIKMNLNNNDNQDSENIRNSSNQVAQNAVQEKVLTQKNNVNYITLKFIIRRIHLLRNKQQILIRNKQVEIPQTYSRISLKLNKQIHKQDRKDQMYQLFIFLIIIQPFASENKPAASKQKKLK
ncbi:wd repeat and hmg-box dna-binding protein 1-like [Stylonychia lemnae]|uniref:Wd repeat and hmg-box dna-binding protein 1-like n=1 Tax=Stylonychia lemnae TaxID=5949 RepID=A0A078AJ68_STYLE|nr:wd repeat and hmg-box dna-binding protein 1-like [Stylonychia lemnae]|eukprot:CDW81941.1 wd repeat and hmg-box dna-binding protein 1-like [Stylonychia lemnae]